MARFKPKIKKNKLLDDGWFARPRGDSAKMVSDIPSRYRCPKCGYHVQIKIAVVMKSNHAGNVTVEPKITCNDCGEIMIDMQRREKDSS